MTILVRRKLQIALLTERINGLASQAGFRIEIRKTVLQLFCIFARYSFPMTGIDRQLQTYSFTYPVQAAPFYLNQILIFYRLKLPAGFLPDQANFYRDFT